MLSEKAGGFHHITLQVFYGWIMGVQESEVKNEIRKALRKKFPHISLDEDIRLTIELRRLEIKDEIITYNFTAYYNDYSMAGTKQLFEEET
jgi:hypothetical protein